MNKLILRLKDYQYKILTEIVILFNLIFLWFRFNEQGQYAWVYYFAVFCVLSSVNLICKSWLGKTLIYPSILILYIYLIAQEIYFSAFEQYFLFITAIGSTEALAGVKDSVIELIKPASIITLFVFFLNLIPVIFLRATATKNNKQKAIFVLSGLLCFLVAGISCYSVEKSIIKETEKTDVMQYYGTKEYFYTYIPNTNVIVRNFGTFGLLYRDTIARLYIINDTQYGIDDELIIRVLDRIEEDNSEIPNEYTGLFEGKNLVVIQAESLMNGAIDETLTPNIYKLYSEGLVFSGFNAPLLYGSTSDTEFMAITGLAPVSTGAITFDDYHDNIYPTTIANMFTNKGYVSTAYHSNYGNYYSRDEMYPQLGFELFDFIGMGEEFLALDSSAMMKIAWMINWADKYFAYFVTYNGHQPYTPDVCEVFQNYSDDYYDKVRKEYPEISDELVCYMVKNMDLDKGIGDYIQHIATLNEDTVIILLGDHFAKGISDDSGFLSESSSYYTPLIIWSSDVDGVKIDKTSNTLDILPTIANLFNLEYNKKTVFGRDIFDDSYHGFYFNNFGYYRTDDYYYDSSTDSIGLYTNRLTEEEARIEMNEYILRLNVSRTIIETDFFARYPEYR